MSTNLKQFKKKNKSTISPTTKNLNLALTSNQYFKWTHSKDKISITSLCKAYFLKKLRNCISLVCQMKFKPIKDLSKFILTLLETFSFNLKSVLTNPVSVWTLMLTFWWQKLITQLFFQMETFYIDFKQISTRPKVHHRMYGLGWKDGVQALTHIKGKSF